MAEDSDQLSEMLDRYRRADECAAELYDLADADIRFVSKPGEQWDHKLKQRRGDRPCYEFPKLQGHIRQVVNSLRQALPQGKVRGVEESDTGLAEIMNGLCRNIQDTSDADLAHIIAFTQSVKGGMGVWRIRTDYEDEASFDQCIYIEPIRNFRAVKFDPAACRIDRSDGLFTFVEEYIPEEEFERKYPKADVRDFEGSRAVDWYDAGKVRVAEYWYKKPVKRELWALSSNEIVWADESDEAALQASGITITKRRTVDTHKVYMRLTNGAAWLTDESEFPSKYIPIIPTFGDIENIGGEDYWQGLTRESKDSQRLHNVHKTAAIEAVAKAPKAPFILKLKWIKGLEKFWNAANSEDYPYLPLADDAPDGALPQRARQAEVPTALLQLAAIDNDDIKSGTGIYDPSLGAQAQETSGVAIQKRQQQSSTSTFNYSDNLAYAIKHEYRILIDMIPRVYDTPRVVRIIGEDGAEQWKQLYQTVIDPETGQPHTVNDISKGKYDETVTVGPSFATQRMEAVTAFGQLVGQIGPSFPPLAMLLAYEVVKNLDLPGNEEVSEAVRKILVGQGLLQPDKDDPPPSPPQPNPLEQAKAQDTVAAAQLKQAQAGKVVAETQAILPKAHAQIEKDLAQATGQHVQAMFKPITKPPPASGINTQGM